MYRENGRRRLLVEEAARDSTSPNGSAAQGSVINPALQSC